LSRRAGCAPTGAATEAASPSATVVANRLLVMCIYRLACRPLASRTEGRAFSRMLKNPRAWGRRAEVRRAGGFFHGFPAALLPSCLRDRRRELFFSNLLARPWRG